MACADPNTLLSQNPRFPSLTESEKSTVKLALLCQISSGIGPAKVGNNWVLTKSGNLYAYNSTTGLYRQLNMIFIGGIPNLQFSSTETPFGSLV